MIENVKKARQDLLKRHIHKGYDGYFDVSGLSMTPFIKPKDKVLVAPKKRYKFGDVIVFQNGSRLIIHRILVRGNKKIFTKGDHNFQGDGWVKKKDVLGRVESINGILTQISFLDYLITSFSFLIAVITYGPKQVYYKTLYFKENILGDPKLGVYYLIRKTRDLFFSSYWEFMRFLNKLMKK